MNIYIFLKWNYFILGWVEVVWINGILNFYCMGVDGKFDLCVVEIGFLIDFLGEFLFLV